MAALLALCVLAAGLFPPLASAAGRCGQHPWCDTSLSPDQRAELLLGALTRDEKISLLAGDELFGALGAEGTHTGTSNGIPRLEVPTTYYSDGPVGVRSGRSTPMPASIGLAATFSEQDAERFASVVADEVRNKGNDVVFAPTVNILRTALWGRAFETFGEDPFLTARLGVAWIRAAQRAGVMANVKHYAVNNQEGAFGIPPVGGTVGGRMTVNAVVDERALREIYLPQFEAAVKEANVSSVMCAYPRVNGAFACENRHLQEEILRGEWGFKGYILADYGAAKNTFGNLANGLDFEPWPGVAYTPLLVNAALGLLPPETLDEHVRRILRTMFAYGFFDREPYVYDNSRIDKEGHKQIAGEIEEQAIVLLKNSDGVLPVDPTRVRGLALIGADATRYKGGGGSAAIQPFSVITPREGIEARAAAAGVHVSYDDGSDPGRAAALARNSDLAVVVAADTASEGTDKACMSLDCNGTLDGLIDAVATANPRTVVVLETGAPVLTPWREKVAGLLEAWYPGAGGGSAIARVLFGDVDPGGRLPATFPRAQSQEPYAGDPQAYPGVLEEVRYKEGVLVGYRWYDERGLEPAFPFGHGLSYSRFRYSGLRVGPRAVSVRVENVGRRPGTEVAQLYLELPEPGPRLVQPPRQLKGFRKLSVRRGRSERVRFPLDDRSFSYWSNAAGGWRVEPGCYGVVVGRSSRDPQLRGAIAIDANGRRRAAGPKLCPGGLARPRARRLGLRLRVRRSLAVGRLVLPRGLHRLDGCRGRVVVRLKRTGSRSVRRRVRLNRRCRYRARVPLSRGAKVSARFRGNAFVRGVRARSRILRP